LLEEIVCDADLFHWAPMSFLKRNKLLRRKWKPVRDKKISKDEWRKTSVRFMEKPMNITRLLPAAAG